MYSSSASVREAGEQDEAILCELLEAYHDWNSARIHRTFGETYESQAFLAADIETLVEGDGGHVWFLAEKETNPAGCLLLSRAGDTVSELKRVYVQPSYRGEGIGRTLVETAIETAKEHDDTSIRLSTGPHSKEAHSLYETLGFVAVPPYAGVEVPERFHEQWNFLELKIGEDE